MIRLGSSAMGTLVERKTRYTMRLHLPRLSEPGAVREQHGPALAGHGAEAIRKAITDARLPLPRKLRKSLTWDRGAEMAQPTRLREAPGMQIYFCPPSPGPRGTNENTNGLLRQSFPKGTELARCRTHELAAVTEALNHRPRQVPGGRTPAEAFADQLASCVSDGVARTG